MMQQNLIEAARAAFEFEMLQLDIIDDEGLERDDDTGEYIDEPAAAAWKAWQLASDKAARAQQATAEDSSVVQQAPAGRLSYFAYDPDTGFEQFNTEAEAMGFAQAAIDAYRDAAGDGWDEGVENVCWGVVHGTTQQVAVEDDYDGREGLGDMLFVDYILTGPAPAQVEQRAPGSEGKRAWFRQASEFGPWIECAHNHPDAVLFQEAAPAEAQVDQPPIVEQIARQWDECEYEASGGNIDIGAAIRTAGARLVAEAKGGE